jgi:hypothetical protein
MLDFCLGVLAKKYVVFFGDVVILFQRHYVNAKGASGAIDNLL